MAMNEAWCHRCGDDPTVECDVCHSLAEAGPLALFNVIAEHGRVVIDIREGETALAIAKLSPREAVKLADRLRSAAVHAEYTPRSR